MTCEADLLSLSHTEPAGSWLRDNSADTSGLLLMQVALLEQL